MKKISSIVLWALMLIALPMQAVQNYYCDFETQEMRDRWVMNQTANDNIYSLLANKWFIGEQGNNDKTGHYGLYISDDEGVTAHYTGNACWVVAYDTVTLNHLSTDDDYVLTFDYCGQGNVNSYNPKNGSADGIYLMWIPVEDGVPANSNATFASIPSEYDNYIIRLQPKSGYDYLSGTQTWQTYVGEIKNKKCDGKPHLLVFVWANKGIAAQQPGGKIDNISILDTRPCEAPTNLTVTYQGSTSTLSWTGTASEYEVITYSYETEEWYGPKTATGTSIAFSNLPMGQTDFIVRAKCDEELYSIKTVFSDFVYYPDEQCIPFLSLDNTNCYVASTKVSGENWMSSMKWVKSYVNMGAMSEDSRHTKHFRKDEYDPRTVADDGTPGLRTVPDGELASVRLGNWLAGSEAERIEYKYHVDARSSAVMMLKYAIVLQKPNDSCKPNPGFLLRVLDKNKNLISDCASADFDYKAAAASGDPTWHESHPGSASDVVKWKDWTPVGINLSAYDGQDLTVQLTSYDCGGGGHYGYSYFTLHCTDGKFKGMKCGEINPVFEAPDGFVYRWAYKSSEQYRDSTGKIPEQYVLGHDQIYEAGEHDDSTYVVDCMFVQDSACFFSLYASTLATNPIAIMKEPVITKNCGEGKYTLQLDGSDSWVQEIDHVKNDTLVSQIYSIDRYEWNITGPKNFWSDEVSPTFTLPASGGDYTITFRTACGSCDSILTYHLHLDSIGPTYETREVYLCDDVRKTGYVWDERPDTLYKDYGLDSVILYSETTSCDSIIYLNLIEPTRVYVDTMVLPESLPFVYRGRSYDHTMIDTIPNAACDTTWVLNFEVYESVQVDMIKDYILCEHDPILTLVYDVTRGRSLRYSYKFDDPAMPSISPVSEVQKKGHYELPINLDPNLMPNIYKGSILFEDSLPKFNLTIPFTLTMQYASSVIAQRWNDVLAIKNADHNGGYTFDSIQWYVNGSPIVGANDYVYYAGEGQQLQMGAEYRAFLRRPDGVMLFTCVFTPTPVAADVTDMPSLVPLNAQIPVRGRGTAVWLDPLGRRYGSEDYDDSSITAPSTAGYWLLLLQADEASTIHPILVR